MIIVSEEDGIRIDSYLSSKLDYSRSRVQRLIKDNKIKVNGKIINNSYLIKLNDEISVELEIDSDVDVQGEDIPLDIIYEDDDLLIINKESGMVVHPAPGHYSGTLVNALLYRYSLSGGDSFRPGIVHRLDKDTSGLMIVAKNEWAHDKLSSMISKKEVERKYLAIVSGVIKHDTGTIDAPVGRDENNRQKMAVTDHNGKDAITHFKVLERFCNSTYIECKLDTGRTHQIRVHMAYLGTPILGDTLYGKESNLIARQALHAYHLSFEHPITHEWIAIEAKLPEDMKKIKEQEPKY